MCLRGEQGVSWVCAELLRGELEGNSLSFALWTGYRRSRGVYTAALEISRGTRKCLPAVMKFTIQ